MAPVSSEDIAQHLIHGREPGAKVRLPFDDAQEPPHPPPAPPTLAARPSSSVGQARRTAQVHGGVRPRCRPTARCPSTARRRPWPPRPLPVVPVVFLPAARAWGWTCWRYAPTWTDSTSAPRPRRLRAPFRSSRCSTALPDRAWPARRRGLAAVMMVVVVVVVMRGPRTCGVPCSASFAPRCTRSSARWCRCRSRFACSPVLFPAPRPRCDEPRQGRYRQSLVPLEQWSCPQTRHRKGGGDARSAPLSLRPPPQLRRDCPAGPPPLGPRRPP